MKEKDIIATIRSLDESEIDKWIENRITELEESSEKIGDFAISPNLFLLRKTNNRNNIAVRGYISSDTEIKKMDYDMAGFKLDDTSVYRPLVDWIRKLDANKINNGMMMYYVQNVLNNCFGERGNDNKRNQLYDSRSDIDSEPLSIMDFVKNKGTAMCVERSAMAQNLLSFLGYDSLLVYGHLSSEKGNMNEAHAYNCIIRNGKGMLVDFTNPLYIDGKIRPAFFPISEKELSKVMKGNSQIEVQHIDKRTEDGKLKEKPISLVYSSEEIDPKFFDKKKDILSQTVTLTEGQVLANEMSSASRNIAEQMKQREMSRKDKSKSWDSYLKSQKDNTKKYIQQKNAEKARNRGIITEEDYDLYVRMINQQNIDEMRKQQELGYTLSEEDSKLLNIADRIATFGQEQSKKYGQDNSQSR